MQKHARSKGVGIHTYSVRVSTFCSRQFFVFQTVVKTLIKHKLAGCTAFLLCYRAFAYLLSVARITICRLKSHPFPKVTNNQILMFVIFGDGMIIRRSVGFCATHPTLYCLSPSVTESDFSYYL
jgi:hypothetical protein